MCLPLGACCARLVVFQLCPNPTVFLPPPLSPRSLARSPSLRTLHGAGYERTDIHSGAAASSSPRAIAPAPCMTSGGEGGGGDLAQGLGLSRAYWTAKEGCLEIQISRYVTVKAQMHKIHSCSFFCFFLIVCFDGGAAGGSSSSPNKKYSEWSCVDVN